MCPTFPLLPVPVSVPLMAHMVPKHAKLSLVKLPFPPGPHRTRPPMVGLPNMTLCLVLASRPNGTPACIFTVLYIRPTRLYTNDFYGNIVLVLTSPALLGIREVWLMACMTFALE